MPDTSPDHVDFVITLDSDLAADVDDVVRKDRSFIGKAIEYALVKRIIFEQLLEKSTQPN